MPVLHWIALVSALAGVQQPAELLPVGVIEVYGARRIAEQQILEALQLKVGDPFPDARVGREARMRVEAIPGVAQVRVTGGCCDRGKTTISVGIQERGQPALQFRAEPHGSVRLPDDIVKAGAAFDEAQEHAVLSGQAEEETLSLRPSNAANATRSSKPQRSHSSEHVDAVKRMLTGLYKS